MGSFSDDLWGIMEAWDHLSEISPSQKLMIMSLDFCISQFSHDLVIVWVITIHDDLLIKLVTWFISCYFGQ